MIEIKDLYLKYIKEYYALYDITLKVNKGDIVALIGEEDSGKTSLLRVICKLEKYTAGEVYVKDIPAKKLNLEIDVVMGYLPETPIFLNNKTVYENFVYFFKVWKMPEKDYEEKINNVLIEYSIEKLRNSKINQLTVYEKYLISLIRLSFRPLEILLIDNIFDRLNEEERDSIIQLIKKLYSSNKCTTLFATTKEEIAKKLTKKSFYFQNGALTKSV